MTDQDHLMTEESQRAHITACFHTLLNRQVPLTVTWTDNEEIVVSLTPQIFFLMEIGSDDDRYRFELWYDCRDTGIYVEFAFPGEEL